MPIVKQKKQDVKTPGRLDSQTAVGLLENNVPADYGRVNLVNSSVLFISMGRTSQQGHYIQHQPVTLTKSGLIFKHWQLLYPLLLSMLGTPKRAEMVKEALRIQAITGECFASARYLAGAGLGSEKTWDRLVGRLKAAKLIRVIRLTRPDGTKSVNLLDFSALWNILHSLVVRKVTFTERIKRRFFVKVSGAWLDLSITATSGLSPPT